MQKLIKIKQGSYRNAPIYDTVFPLVKPMKVGKKGMFVTVDASNILGTDKAAIRVLIENIEDVEYVGTDTPVSVAPAVPVAALVTKTKPAAPAETPEEAMDRIRKRFAILDQMTDAVANGVVRGLIVSGPPGVGKSFGVERILDEYEAMHKLSGGKDARTEVVKGSMSPIGLFQTLFNNSREGDILVFDDCDSILFDEVCLNMLKAVLDSGKKRTISWKSESNALRREGIPDRFDFKGGCIFITNVNFENVRSKKIQDHLQALMSRCHYIDLGMDSVSDRFLRINQIVNDGMLAEYDFGDEGEQEVVDFMIEKSARLREISLRMVLKVADLKKMAPENWRELAESTCMKRFA
jgi:hypothetical protein